MNRDTDAVALEIGSLVDAYNSAMETLNFFLEADAETGEFGVLGRDTALRQARLSLANYMSRLFSGLNGYDYQSLAEIGITGGNDDGTYDIDSNTLNTALQADLENVRLLFQGTNSDTGVANGLEDYLETLLNSVDGILVEKQGVFSSAIDNINDQIDRYEIRIQRYQDLLETRFNSLELRLAQLNSQQSALEGFINSLNNN